MKTKTKKLPKTLVSVIAGMRIRLLDGQHEDLAEFWKRRVSSGHIPYAYEIRDELRPQISVKRYRELVDTERPAEFYCLGDDEVNAVLRDILKTTLSQRQLAEKHGLDDEHVDTDRLMRSIFDYFRQRWISLDGFEYFGNEGQTVILNEKLNHRKSPKQIHEEHGFSYPLISKALRELEKKLSR